MPNTPLWKTYLSSSFTGFPFKACSFLLPTGSLQGVLWGKKQAAKLRGRQPQRFHAQPCRRGQQHMLLTACFSCFDTSKPLLMGKPQTETSAPEWATDSPPHGGRELEPRGLLWTHITTHGIPANPPSKNGRIPNSLRGSSLPPNQVRLPPNQVQVHLLVWRSPMWKCKKGGHFLCFSFYFFPFSFFTFYDLL